MKISIHRALAELKTIGKRIEDAIASLNPSGITQNNGMVNFMKKEDFEAKAKADFQSVTDLIERRNKIKSAIVGANATVTVEIAKKAMTIADAINLKSVIAFKKALIETLRKKHTSSKAKVEQGNAKVDQDALGIMNGMTTQAGVKAENENVQQMVKAFKDFNTFSLVDPLEADKLVEKLSKEVSDFETEVDAVLSEANAVNFIEI